MSGETRKSQSGWTVDTLNAHLVTLLDERDKEFQGRFDAQERAIQIALEADQKARASLQALIETRLDAMDKATQLLSATVNRVPTDVDKQVGNLRSLHEEKFQGIQTQLTQRFADNKLAVDAAFAAAKEAVAEQNKSSALAIAKSETATAKQIDSLGVAVDSKFKATDDKVDDLKGAVSQLTVTVSTLAQKVASQRSFETESQTQRNWSTGTLVAATIGLLSLLVSVVVAIILAVHG